MLIAESTVGELLLNTIDQANMAIPCKAREGSSPFVRIVYNIVPSVLH